METMLIRLYLRLLQWYKCGWNDNFIVISGIILLSLSGNTYRLLSLMVILKQQQHHPQQLQTYSVLTLLIIVIQISGSNHFDGHISNARFVKGTALYTSSFTPQGELYDTSYFAVSPQQQLDQLLPKHQLQIQVLDLVPLVYLL